MSISQAEFEVIRLQSKQFDKLDNIELGHSPWIREIICIENRDTYQIYYRRGSIEIKKFTFNKLFRKSIVLCRYDSRGRHTNPDGTVFDGPHVHMYDENYGDRVAYPVTILGLVGDLDMDIVLKAFLDHFSITPHPIIQRSMF